MKGTMHVNYILQHTPNTVGRLETTSAVSSTCISHIDATCAMLSAGRQSIPLTRHSSYRRTIRFIVSASASREAMQPQAPSAPSEYRGAYSAHPAEAAFKDLGINQDLYREVGGVRVRQHVNPLKKELQQLTPPPDWPAVYENLALPMAVDIGAGYGRFSLALKNAKPDYNMIGIEIRNSVRSLGFQSTFMQCHHV